MPRTGRIVLPGYPHHVVQRGHNRQTVFAKAADFQRYLDDLRELKDQLGVRVHAYCLMTNHVHLLLTPADDPSSLGRLMKVLAARATRYRNRLESRSGTLWEGRVDRCPFENKVDLSLHFGRGIEHRHRARASTSRRKNKSVPFFAG